MVRFELLNVRKYCPDKKFVVAERLQIQNMTAFTNSGFQSAVFDCGHKMASCVIYEVKNSQCHLLATIENNWLVRSMG